MIRWLLVAACGLLFVLALAGMRRGWQQRGRRQDWLPELPSVPVAPASLGAELAAPLTGLYVGTTLAARWQDRIVAGGLGTRAEAVARLTEAGVVIDRQASTPVFLPAARLIDARLEPALAGKVVGQGGLLVLRWRHGEQDLDTGIRADDRTGYPAWITAIDAVVATKTRTDRNS